MTVACGVATDELLARKRLRLHRDPSRVIAKLFVPGAQPSDIVQRVLALSDEDVETSYAHIFEHFGSRHRDLEETFRENYRTIAHPVGDGADVSGKRRLLIGAHFTHEYAIEGAALTNPSMVAHPDQSGLQPGELRFLMSARAIGEGHLSCVEFRTGVVGSGGDLRVDPPSPYASIGSVRATRYERSALEAVLAGSGDDGEVPAHLLSDLPEYFTDAELEACLGTVDPRIDKFLACQYRVEFGPDADVSEHVLWPRSPTERRGIEDARFVRCVDPDGSVMYRGTYTAYSGTGSATQLLETTDFQTFRMSQLFGPAVGDKGLALFPRRVEGRHVALSRWDRKSNAIATSDDGRVWQRSRSLETTPRTWELTQVGNCGSPIETEAGWLALTHGVGPMRTYALGAILLDLKDPTRVIGALRDPLLIAAPDERDGYVPNVVYSCGGLLHDDLLVIPYGFGDMGIEFATVSMSGLLDRLEER